MTGFTVCSSLPFQNMKFLKVRAVCYHSLNCSHLSQCFHVKAVEGRISYLQDVTKVWVYFAECISWQFILVLLFFSLCQQRSLQSKLWFFSVVLCRCESRMSAEEQMLLQRGFGHNFSMSTTVCIHFSGLYYSLLIRAKA